MTLTSIIVKPYTNHIQNRYICTIVPRIAKTKLGHCELYFYKCILTLMFVKVCTPWVHSRRQFLTRVHVLGTVLTSRTPRTQPSKHILVPRTCSCFQVVWVPGTNFQDGVRKGRFVFVRSQMLQLVYKIIKVSEGNFWFNCGIFRLITNIGRRTEACLESNGSNSC